MLKKNHVYLEFISWKLNKDRKSEDFVLFLLMLRQAKWIFSIGNPWNFISYDGEYAQVCTILSNHAVIFLWSNLLKLVFQLDSAILWYYVEFILIFCYSYKLQKRSMIFREKNPYTLSMKKSFNFYFEILKIYVWNLSEY